MPNSTLIHTCTHTAGWWAEHEPCAVCHDPWTQAAEDSASALLTRLRIKDEVEKVAALFPSRRNVA